MSTVLAKFLRDILGKAPGPDRDLQQFPFPRMRCHGAADAEWAATVDCRARREFFRNDVSRARTCTSDVEKAGQTLQDLVLPQRAAWPPLRRQTRRLRDGS